MEERYKFSVLMSVYKNDKPEFFKEALESVSVEQTLKPDQIVIVYDGPVLEEIDGIIDDCKKKNEEIEYTIIKKMQNEGLAAALNTGLSACKFDWVARMDSDDISTNDRFEKQFNYLKNNQGISVLGGFVSEFDENPGELISTREVGITHEAICKMAKTRTPMNHMSVIYLKNDILNLGGYSENFGKLEDYKLWVDAISAGYKLANISDVIVYARVGNGFIERRSSRREIHDWDMLQKYLKKAGLIGRFKAFKNKIYIRIFIYTPKWIKRFLYKKVLRKKTKEFKS